MFWGLGFSSDVLYAIVYPTVTNCFEEFSRVPLNPVNLLPFAGDTMSDKEKTLFSRPLRISFLQIANLNEDSKLKPS